MSDDQKGEGPGLVAQAGSLGRCLWWPSNPMDLMETLTIRLGVYLERFFPTKRTSHRTIGCVPPVHQFYRGISASLGPLILAAARDASHGSKSGL